MQALQAALRAEFPGLVARLLVAEGEATLMEIYARPGLGVDAALQDEIERRTTAFAALLDSPRHVEVFVAPT
ncbi:MAG: DUF4936 family protein [Pseudomonadota bacterium]|nr:DUF4936 family protein [Pseudomonadota bacterium]